MAQRQFRSNDTSVWTYRFGNGQDGAKTWSATKTLDGGDNAYYNTFTGTSGALTGTLGSVWTWTGPVFIHQTQGTGAGSWELNYIIDTGSTTATLLLPLTNTYGTGAQIITCGQYSSATLNNGTTLSVPAWNGATGGMGFLLVNGPVNIVGTLNASGTGFRGGAAYQGNSNGGGTQIIGQQGEGTPGLGGNVYQVANGNGGGGGQGNDFGNQNADAGGGGAGGIAGTKGGVNGVDKAGLGGNVIENAGLTLLTPGGGGGGGGSDWPTNHFGGAGANGAGSFIIIARSFTLSGAITLRGSTGSNASGPDSSAGGGGGGGGSCLIKGQTVSLGSNLIAAQGGSGGTGTSGTNGGAGGAGWVHVDSLLAPTGTTSPTLDSRIDPVFADSGGSFLLNFM